MAQLSRCFRLVGGGYDIASALNGYCRLHVISDPPAMTQAIVADLAKPIRSRQAFISTILGPQLELTLQIDDQVVFSEMFDTADLLVGR